MLLYNGVSHLSTINVFVPVIPCCGAILGTVGGLAVSLTSTH